MELILPVNALKMMKRIPFCGDKQITKQCWRGGAKLKRTPLCGAKQPMKQSWREPRMMKRTPFCGANRQ